MPKAPEPGEGSFMTPREREIQADALALAARIEEREREGLPLLPASRAGKMLFGWGTKRGGMAKDCAVEHGLLHLVKKGRRAGYYLSCSAGQTPGREG